MSFLENLPIETKSLHVPELCHLQEVLEKALKLNFSNVTVDTNYDCPDLSTSPWNLAEPGIGGNPCIADVGGVPNLLPTPNKSKLYNLKSIAKQLKMSDAFIIGPGAGPFQHIGTNCEMMANTKLSSCDSNDKIKTQIAKVDVDTGIPSVYQINNNDFCLMANLLLSEGKQCKVIKINASKRIGDDNFVTCIRKILNNEYKEQPVGMGGVFLLKKGKANLHIMPEFSDKPLSTNEEVDKWLKFYNCDAPLVCLSVLVSHDPGLDLRLEHTHCFSEHNQGGHYHYDTTPDDVEYEAYYVLAEKIHRVDRINS